MLINVELGSGFKADIEEVFHRWHHKYILDLIGNKENRLQAQLLFEDDNGIQLMRLEVKGKYLISFNENQRVLFLTFAAFEVEAYWYLI